jgi:hypothetical protein
MKKVISWLLIIAIAVSLTACANVPINNDPSPDINNEPNPTPAADNTPSPNQNPDVDNGPEPDPSIPSTHNEPSPDPTPDIISSPSPNGNPGANIEDGIYNHADLMYSVFRYESLNDLLAGLTKDFDEETLREIEFREGESKKGTFEAFLNSRKDDSRNGGLWIPFYQGKVINFENKSQLSAMNTRIANIMVSELFNEPWIWFYGSIGGHDVIIRTMYIDDKLIEEAGRYGTEWLHQQIWPFAPKEEYPKYSRVEKAEILVDNKRVPVFLGYFDEIDNRVYIDFVYNHMLVIIVVDPAILDKDGLADLSFERYTGD